LAGQVDANRKSRQLNVELNLHTDCSQIMMDRKPSNFDKYFLFGQELERQKYRGREALVTPKFGDMVATDDAPMILHVE